MKKRIIDIVTATKIPIIRSEHIAHRILKHEIKISRPKKRTTKPSSLAKLIVCLPEDAQGEILSFIKCLKYLVANYTTHLYIKNYYN